MNQTFRRYHWHLLEVDGVLVFRVTGQAQLTRIRISAYQWAQRHGWVVECLTIPGVLFVVRYGDDIDKLAASRAEVICQADPDETKCRASASATRSRGSTVRRSGRRPLLTLRTVPRWAQPALSPNGRRLPSKASTANR